MRLRSVILPLDVTPEQLTGYFVPGYHNNRAGIWGIYSRVHVALMFVACHHGLAQTAQIPMERLGGEGM